MNSDNSAASDGDSFLDYYRGAADSRNGIGSGYSSRKHSLADRSDNDNADNSAWIHRDKLAKIESRELQEAGLWVGQHTSGSRSNSRSTSRRRGESEPRSENEYLETSPERGTRGEQLRRLPSAEEGLAEEDEQINHELRTLEEVAAEQSQFPHVREAPIARPGTSRIPLPKNSPAPLPSSYIARDLPLPRSRNNSLGNGLEDGIALNKMRGRSQSGASQRVLDDFNLSGTQSPEAAVASSPTISRYSPTKAKVPSKATPTSGGRKSNSGRAASAPQKKQQRTGSVPTHDSPAKRPASSGTPSRPSTSYNRPEGEAPWIATMYKPDPRLPPDQQMLPTHAKRMMQEQWEKEGKTGTAYDREFRLVTPHEFEPPLPNSAAHGLKSEEQLEMDEKVEERQEERRSSPAWPLTPLKLETDVPSNRPSLSGTEHGGYRITPTVQSPQISPNIQQRPLPASPENTRPPDPIRIPEPPEEKEEKKKAGCACCAIM